MNAMSSALLYLINTVFDLYLIVLSVRLILAWERANAANPIIQFVLTVTNPIVGSLRRVIPSKGKLELATLLAIILLEILKFLIISMLFANILRFDLLLLLSLLATIKLILNTFFFSILFYAILSWVNASTSPIGEVLFYLSEPILRPFRRIIPRISGFDISPIPALIILQLLIILL